MNIALFGRHPSPAEHIVFPEGIPEDKMNDYSWMESQCVGWLEQIDESEFEKCEWYGSIVRLYVEGFTPALISFLKAWEEWYGVVDERPYNAPMLHLMHYQPDGTYDSQKWQR